MNMFATVSSLSVVTIVIVLALLIAALVWHRRRPSNRNPLGETGMEANHPVQDARDRL